MARYRRIGYYNDREDIINLSDSPRDEIVKHMQSGLGHFYPTDNDECDFNDFDPSTISGEDGDRFIVQSSVAVVYDPDGESDFIDVYEKIS